MQFAPWTIHVATVPALMRTPGPSQLLILSSSAAHGFRRATATIAGDLSANTLPMPAAGLGLAAILSACGIGSGRVASRFKGDTKLWVERAGGGFMIFAALLLGLKTISDR